jgi:RHS repeat-associated protein
LIYDGEDVALEVDGSGSAVAFWLHGPGVDQPIAMERDGETYVYVQDGAGTVRALARLSDRKVVRTYRYSASGRLLSETGTVENPYGFQGRERDPITGLVHFRTREYDPEVGRFLSTDPMRFAGIWNPYAFPGMDPVNRTDPSGAGPRALRGAGKAAAWYADLKSSIDDKVAMRGSSPAGPQVGEVGSMVFKGGAVNAFEATRFFPMGKITPYASPGPTVLDAAGWAYKGYMAKDPCERAKVAGDMMTDILPAGKTWFKPMVDKFNSLGTLVDAGR